MTIIRRLKRQGRWQSKKQDGPLQLQHGLVGVVLAIEVAGEGGGGVQGQEGEVEVYLWLAQMWKIQIQNQSHLR